MKQEISELMDGELLEHNTTEVFRLLKQDKDAEQNWQLYHLIGDAMRQPDLIKASKCDVAARLVDEPTVLAPRQKTFKQNLHTWSISLAAALSAVGVVAWMSLQMDVQSNGRFASSSKTFNQTMTSDDSNDYVMAHQEFSHGPDMNGVAYYVRTAHPADAK